MNCSVRLKTNEMDLALLLAAGVATRHTHHQQQQQQHTHSHLSQSQTQSQQYLQQTNTTTIITANTNHNNNITTSITNQPNFVNLPNSSNNSNQQNFNTFEHHQSTNTTPVGTAATMFEQRTTPVANALEMIRASSPITNVNDSTQYLRASSVSLQSQATTVGVGGGVASSRQQQHLQFSDNSAATQNTTPRAVDNQYSFV